MLSKLRSRKLLLLPLAGLAFALWPNTDGDDSNESTAEQRSHLQESANRARGERPALVAEARVVTEEPGDEELLPKARALTEEEMRLVPEGSILFERFTLDELRAEQGLPAIDAALIRREDFPEETREEAMSPERHELYSMAKEIHRTKYLAQHKVVERNRYWAKAQTAEDEETRALYLSSARYHAQIALAQQERYSELVAARYERIAEMREKRLGLATASPSPR